MTEKTPQAAAEVEIRALEKRLGELIATLDRLKEENRSLRARQESLAAERAALVQKNEQVRARVEAMIGRLKSMEHGP
jgi:cell division protein ZapB